jgi:formate hydrogenlyase subunit 6/NADH:ubiquinone oxidoreductase subunit I
MDTKTHNDLLKLFQGKLNQAMRFYLETCTRCGVCTEACHVYASMGQIRYIAAYRHEIIRRLYKKYFKARGKVWPSVGESKELTKMALTNYMMRPTLAPVVAVVWFIVLLESTPKCLCPLPNCC